MKTNFNTISQRTSEYAARKLLEHSEPSTMLDKLMYPKGRFYHLFRLYKNVKGDKGESQDDSRSV